jgi:cell division protein FtsL
MLDTQIATKTNRRNELDAEIAELKEQIASAKTKRLQTLAIKDAEIADLEAQIAAYKTHA